MVSRRLFILSAMLVQFVVATFAQETLPPLNDALPPQNYEELWADFDPRAEPLDIEILKEWDEDDVVLRVVRFRVGVFKGEKAMLAGVYGFPKGGTKLPGLVQIHGGGQYADYRAPLANAKRGYASISISWAGRINAPDHKVSPAEVKLFWEGKTEDPAYRVTTDWGAMDGYHAPSRFQGTIFPKLRPLSWTLDTVDSPRNCPWFFCTMAARRALTFLEEQPEVDPDKLGVYGHSMGGKLTVLTAGTDSRVKAAVPSCGGISDRHNDSALFRATMGDDVYLEKITCPILFQSPANDFHGRIDDQQIALTEIQTNDWRVTSAAHHNHQDTANYEVAALLWFDQYLKGEFNWPETPATQLKLSAVPQFAVKPDTSKPVLAVDFFYARHGQMDGKKDDSVNTKARFWHHAKAEKRGDYWVADLPLHGTEQPLWVYANVLYPLDEPKSAVGYYYGAFTTETFNLSSKMEMISVDALKRAGVESTMPASLLIESFDEGWEKAWFSYRPQEWGRKTHKIYDLGWAAPEGAQLAFEVKAEEANKMVVGVDDYAVEVVLVGRGRWQEVILSQADFNNAAGEAIASWKGIRQLRLLDKDRLKLKVAGENKSLSLGAPWKGERPEFRNLRWVR